MKKQLLILLLAAFASLTSSAYDFCVDGIYYKINGTEATVVSGECSGDVVIPSSVNYDGVTYSVTSIGGSAYYKCYSLTSITIPDSVTSIGYEAFYECLSLTSVNISDLSAWFLIKFSHYSSNPLFYAHNLYLNGELVTHFIIPDSATSIGGYVFCGCSSLTSITIPDSVTSIGDYAFKGCTSLTSITIPDSVTYIGEAAFSGCKSLTSISIPNSVTSINHNTFSGSGLTSVTIPNSVTSIGPGAFGSCHSLTSVTISDSVTSIDYHAFNWCGELSSVTIGKSVASIGDGAFFNCFNLTSVNISDISAWCSIKFTNSTSNPLYYAHNLYLNGELVTDLVIPDSVTSIGYITFYDCASLTSVIIPDSVTSIGDKAFEDCTSLTSVIISDSVTEIGSSAFYNTALYNDDSNWENKVLYICNHLIKAKSELSGAYTIKEGTLTIADYAFSDCRLTSISIPSSVTKIARGVFYHCYNLTSVNIPDSVTSIGDSAFSNCSGLTSVTIPDSVTSIGDSAFYYCKDLTSVTIPNSVTSIGDSAFYYCKDLTSVTIPNSVTSIGKLAFHDCTSLASLTVENDNPANISLGDSVFYWVPKSTCVLYVPEGSRDLYAAADQWKDFFNIEEFEAGVDDIPADIYDDPDAPYFDLMGRRIVNPTHGLYIHNGKKIFVR